MISRLSRAFLLSTALMTVVPAAPAVAQTVLGSGIAPAEVGNSAERPVQFADSAGQGGVLVVLTDSAAIPATAPLDAATRAAVDAAIASGKFEGKAASTLSLRGIGAWQRILMVGTGTDLTPNAWQKAAGKAAQDVMKDAAPITVVSSASGAALAELALGYTLGQYRFDRYKTVDKKAPPADAVTFVGADSASGAAAWNARHSALAEGVRLSRDLANEPANVIYPASFVDRVRSAFGSTAGVTIEVLDETAMRRLNMGSIVGVGQGSPRGSRMLVVRYNGAGAGASGAPLAMVGKGITFDSGGISLKPGAGMWDMKGDMSGAASAVGAVLSLAKSRAPVNVVAVAALAENMPDGNAQRPGDVVRTMSGKTIEMLNSDAEGRLVLADAVEYVASKDKPAAIVTIATLTGAIVSALDDEYAGLFARDEALATSLNSAGTASGEAVWRMPLHENYAENMKSDIADIRNIAPSQGPGAGLGAHFIGYFVDSATPWAHIDIAGMNQTSSTGPLTPKGMTGYGVRLLDAWARMPR